MTLYLVPLYLVALWVSGARLPGQDWRSLQGRSKSGLVELHQAVRDASTDVLALVVGAHPDDRYLLPTALLRYGHGVRVAVLLATRGGGGQNSLGPETGDALRRIRTLESEAGCRRFDAEVWYLNRPDAGYCWTASEAFAEWGRSGTVRDLARLIREIRPDMVLTAHHREESHGHDLALVEILPEAVTMAGDPRVALRGLPPHRVPRLFLGSPGNQPGGAIELSMEIVDQLRGATYRRLAYDALTSAHVSAGPLAPMSTMFETELCLVPVPVWSDTVDDRFLDGLPDLFTPGVLPDPGDQFARQVREELRKGLRDGLAETLDDRQALVELALELLGELRRQRVAPASEAELRIARRVAALERVIQHTCGILVEVEVGAGAVAAPGEDLALSVRVHNAGQMPVDALLVDGLDGLEVELDAASEEGPLTLPGPGTLRTSAVVRVPLAWGQRRDPMANLFRTDRFVPPVRLRFRFGIGGEQIRVPITVPVDVRSPVELRTIPHTLLLPSYRQSVQFTVEVQRNTRFEIKDVLEVRAPSGYVVEPSRASVEMRDVRGETYDFELQAPSGLKPGVATLQVHLGDQRVPLRVHRVEVDIDPTLSVGLVRGNDNTILEVLGIGGFGLSWTELTDEDLAIRDLGEFDTIVVDIRALRHRTGARRSFRRLLDFCSHEGKRLLVFYHKDTEFQPEGDPFRGAPHAPFVIGRGRVTRADAPVDLLQPEHPLFNSPNRIRPGDWDDWEQERGLYFPSVYSDAYVELLAMNDPGHPQERSALLYAPWGKGDYVYCALSLYRQLKKVHPGGVRLFANLLTPLGR